MPFIRCTTNQQYSDELKSAFKSKCGQLISIIPGKSEDGLMVMIEDGQNMLFRGKDLPCMKVSVEMYTSARYDDKKNFAEALLKAIVEMTGIPYDNIYMNFSEFDIWSDGPTLKRE